MAHTIRNYESPYTADSYWTHLESGETTRALFLKITPSAIWSTLPTLGFTSLDYDVTLANHDDLVFFSSAGLNPSNTEIEGSRPANFELSAVFENEYFGEVELLEGKWNNAEIELWEMNYMALGMGELVLTTGFLSNITDYQDFFKAEIEGFSAKMQGNFGKLTSRLCRHNELGDAGCKKVLTGTIGGLTLKKTLTVHSVPSSNEIWFTRLEAVPDDFYNNGKCEGLTGLNDGIAREIRTVTGVGGSYVKVFLKRPFPLTVSAGNTFELTVGCDRTLDRCRFLENVINRDAEDFIPQIEKAARVPPVE